MWHLLAFVAAAFAQQPVSVEPPETPRTGPLPEMRMPQPKPPLRIPILKVEPAEQRNSVEFTLTPASTREFFKRTYKFPDNSAYWPCRNPARFEWTKTANDSRFFTVGYRHSYEAGTNPMPCATRLVEVGRGGALFDLSRGFNRLAWLDNPDSVVELARLNFRREAVDGRDCEDHLTTSADAWPTASQEWLGGKPWLHSLRMPKDDGPDCAGFGNICEVNVQTVVQEWVRGTRANNGFIFVGENEDMGARGNGACRTKYSDFALQLRISWPVKR